VASFDAEFIARHSAAQGACSILDELLDLKYEDRESELSNEE
jgi:hypothetical protein